MYLIFGKGRSGLATARLLKAFRSPFILVDDSTPNWERYLDRVSAVVVSPGVKPTHKVFHLAEKKGKVLYGETELAFRFWRGQTVAITGTDGKSTTTRLTYLILKNHLPGVYEGGNIGTPFSEVVLSSANGSGIAVLEVSSFQGYTLKTFRPDGGAFISFAPDHLDWHRDIEDYLSGKYRIFQNQREGDFLFLNGSSEEILNTPSGAGKYLFNSPSGGGHLKISPDGWVYFFNEKLFEVSKLKIKGHHNIWNAAVAAAIGRLFGVPVGVIRGVLYTFSGLPHRLQFVGKFNRPKRVEVYNDSKSTTPNALKAALEAFNGKRVVLLFGGKDKGVSFKGLKKLFKERVKYAVAYGENRFRLFEELSDAAPIELEETLEAAFKRALDRLEDGDILLLSPGSASFDLFASYEERGERFIELVREYFG